MTNTPAPIQTGISTAKLGMWIFLISEIMFFTGLIGSYIVLRLGSTEWPNPTTVLNATILGINTVVLLTSSLTMALSGNAIEQGDRRLAQKYLWTTALLGTLFLVIKGVDYMHHWHEGFTIASNMFGACYYFLTGFHGIHVLSGIIVIIYLAIRVNNFTETETERVEASGLYWHFIDLVWVILFAILCLV